MVVKHEISERLGRLNEIGIALSKEPCIPFLLEKILLSAKELTRADGGTLYSVTPEKTLHFEIVVSDSLKQHRGGTSKEPPPSIDLPLFIDGAPNDSLMVAYAANHRETINVKDAYTEKGFDFSGTKKVDAQTGYRTQAVLTIPMKNHEDEVIAVLQLLNPIDPETRRVTTFSDDDVQLAESLASQAGIVLTKQLLIANLQDLFTSLIHVIAAAIDEKSPSTGNHEKRVPVVAKMIGEAVNATDIGSMKGVHFSDEQLYELEVAAILHDCGKITTPEHVVEKQTKLETVFDQIALIETRFALLEKEAENRMLKQKLALMESQQQGDPKKLAQIEQEWEKTRASLAEDLALVKECNKSVEHLDDAIRERILAMETLTDEEKNYLSVVKGNLTPEERKIIEHHVVMTQKMLSQLIYPKDLKEVPEIAGNHHERVNGQGYPRGLKGDQMSVRARILAIADVFEALSAPDRPYKKALPLSKVLEIMTRMVEEEHFDRDLFEIFLKEKVYLTYARDHLSPEQIDVT